MRLLDGIRTWWRNHQENGPRDTVVTKACSMGAHGDACDLPEYCDCGCHLREICGDEFYGWSAPGELVTDFSVPRYCNLPYPHPGSGHNKV